MLARAGIPLDTGPTLRLLPHLHGCDGFFAAVLDERIARWTQAICPLRPTSRFAVLAPIDFHPPRGRAASPRWLARARRRRCSASASPGSIDRRLDARSRAGDARPSRAPARRASAASCSRWLRCCCWSIARSVFQRYGGAAVLPRHRDPAAGRARRHPHDRLRDAPAVRAPAWLDGLRARDRVRDLGPRRSSTSSACCRKSRASSTSHAAGRQDVDLAADVAQGPRRVIVTLIVTLWLSGLIEQRLLRRPRSTPTRAPCSPSSCARCC